HLGLHHDPATSDAVLVAERLDADDLLTGRDFTSDHPVQRSARKDLFHSFRYHAGDVYMALRKTFLLRGLHPFSNPLLEFLDGIAANGKLENVKRHGFSLAMPFVPINRPMPPALAPLGKSTSARPAHAWRPVFLRQAAVPEGRLRLVPGAQSPRVASRFPAQPS